MIRCGWGPERNRNAGSAVAAILALPAVAGKFGVRGGGYTMSNSPAWRDIDERRRGRRRAEPPTRAVNMNQLGAALTELDAPPVKALFVYNANPLATIPNQEKVRAGLARDDLFTVVFDAVWTDTARARRRRAAGDDVPGARRAGARLRRATCCRRRVRSCQPWVRRAPNHAVFGELVRRLGLWREGDPEEPEALSSTPCWRARPTGRACAQALARDGRAVPAFGATPVQFVDVFPQNARRQDRSLSARRWTAWRQTASTAIGPIPRRRRRRSR